MESKIAIRLLDQYFAGSARMQVIMLAGALFRLILKKPPTSSVWL